MTHGDLSEEDVEKIQSGAVSDPTVIQVAALTSVFGVEPSCLLDRRESSLLDKELVQALRDEDVATRRQAARGLGCLGDAAACDGLIAALSDLDAIVRECAARALGKIEDSRGRQTSAGVSDLRLFLFANGIGVLSIGVERDDIDAQPP